MQLGKFENKDVTFSLDANFDLDKWERHISTEAVKLTLQDAKKYLQNELRLRFLQQRGPDGKPWAKLSPITIKLKGGKQTILDWSSGLRRSFKYSMYATELVITTAKTFARLLQKGATYKTTPKQSYWLWTNVFNRVGHPFSPRQIHIPARPFFGFSKGNTAYIGDLLKKHILDSERIGT